MTRPYRIRRKAMGFHPDHFNPGWGDGSFHPPFDGGGRSGGGGGNSPHIDIPATIPDLDVWMRPDLERLTLVGSKVSVWPDLNSNAHPASQGSDPARPTWQANQINGKPAVTFGASIFLGWTPWAQTPAGTIIAVYFNPAATGVSHILHNRSAADSPLLVSELGGSGQKPVFFQNVEQQIYSQALSGWHVVWFSWDFGGTPTTYIAVDNGAEESRVTGTTTLSNWTELGINDPSNFQNTPLAEWIGYRRRISQAAEKAILLGYLQKRYAIW